MLRRCRGIRGDVGIAPYGRTRGAVFGRTGSFAPGGHEGDFGQLLSLLMGQR